MFTRRRFMAALIPGLAVLSGGVTYAGYRTGACPLSSAGYCVGPCTAYLDANGDLLCDRIASDGVAGSEGLVASCDDGPAECVTVVPMTTAQATQVCDRELAVTEADAPLVTPTSVAAPQATATPVMASEPVLRRAAGVCPFNLVNDPYPGRCRRYVDLDGNGICDLSEPSLAGAK